MHIVVRHKKKKVNRRDILSENKKLVLIVKIKKRIECSREAEDVDWPKSD